MMNHEISLELFGPFKWRELFSQPKASERGVYLWTAPYKGQFLVYYVGETGGVKRPKSFARRFVEHTQHQLNGVWGICDSSEFVKGHKKYVWQGSENPTKVVEFLERYYELSKAAIDFLEVIQIFLIPMNDVDEPTRKRVEALIAMALYNKERVTQDFQDENLFSRSNPQSYQRVWKSVARNKKPIKFFLKMLKKYLDYQMN